MDAMAAFVAAGGLVAMAQRLFVFLVDGVAAKVLALMAMCDVLTDEPCVRTKSQGACWAIW